MILAIFGAGGLGREVLDVANDINANLQRWSKIVFVDDASISICGGIEVYSFSNICRMFSVSEIEFSIAIGEPKTRAKIREKISKYGYELTTLIHPNSHISTFAEIGKGVTICYGSYVSCNARIDENVYIQPNAMIGHDVRIEEDSVVGPCAAIAGGCHIGQNSYIGMGSTIKELVSIGDNTIIGMSSAVYRDIGSDLIAVGNPARIVKNNEGAVFHHE